MNLKRILRSLLSIPMSSVDAERGFSALKLIKTRLRNSIKADNLNRCLMIALEGKDISLYSFDKAVEVFQKKSRKRRVL